MFPVDIHLQYFIPAGVDTPFGGPAAALAITGLIRGTQTMLEPTVTGHLSPSGFVLPPKGQQSQDAHSLEEYINHFYP